MEKGPFSVERLAQSSGGGAGGSAAGGGQSSVSRRVGLARGGPAAGGPQGSATPGRSRTKFSAAQLQELERSFREQRYLGAGEKRRLAAALSLSQSQIKTWFQNRRMKLKRQTQDAR
ncbi:VEX1 protein, partial [Geococcyx californianus]|nr:VEX1 protein [Geococcyx californianus]